MDVIISSVPQKLTGLYFPESRKVSGDLHFKEFQVTQILRKTRKTKTTQFGHSSQNCLPS